MSSQQKDEIPVVAEFVAVDYDSEAGSQEGGGASVAMDGETRETEGSEEEEKENEREAQTDGRKDAGELIGGKGVEKGEEEDIKKEGMGEKEGEGESKVKEWERENRDRQAVRDKSSKKARVIEGTGSAIKTKKEGEVKDKPKGKEVEKQSKANKKVGPNPTPTPLGLSRPRSSASSVRGAAKRDIIAKFQQNCPEKPVVRNFKVQRSTTGSSNGASIKQKILQWCQNKTRNYEGVCIENFSSSWCDGLAFCALVHRFFPDAFDFSKLRAQERAKNFALAFSKAESLADCCPLLEVEDMLLMGNAPDPLCVFTYVQALCQHLSKIEKERKDKEEKKRESVTETKEERKGEEMMASTEEGQGDRKGESGKEERSTAGRYGEKRGEEEEGEKEEEAKAAE
ncbi:hypothetical protein COCON_G00120050 [Conger conger]|uniref:Calponin-homology (CH) domain-containing protein n=1 Tax=Conger conger TaxID=82655 RepID=A0A9Q1DGL7_CONCO|nr:smoothelin-like 1 [Conger conger]XP_061106892.1 smoothelin-like 1 [Conger conger]XP_061106893.1 smoothelin-like 1 [Conger conger]XP_061106895.1 smoothelin-like 1 [Conger conger]XP_061106896.1 smoothelin-like 1 [Conger conger]XP_061106897.1 smoothelin-like 1 [Conger conger]XP_061106898.1 smoothelin-like 1 [Conger conger]KAJ8269398.1 hypothetical protein COCON_G00120050 [Conger conger]